MNNYLLFIPKFPAYFTLLWEYLAKHKFQVHRASWRDADLLDKEMLVLYVTLYFPVKELMDYLVLNMSIGQVKKYGSPTYQVKPEKIPRPYGVYKVDRRKKKPEPEQKQLV